MKPEWSTIKVSRERDVGRIALNRPEVRNALSLTVVAELERAVQQLQGTSRVILLEAVGDHFCAGADLRYLTETRDRREFIEQINRAFSGLEQSKIPVVAAVQGYALAGGFELMQACDIVVVSNDAIIGDQHANFGLIPGGGGSQRLPRLVGRQRALALLLTGHRLSGLEAVAWGLAYRSVPSAALREQGLALASEIASKSLDGLTAMKRLVDEGSSKSLPDAIECEVETFLTWLDQPDAREGLQAFREKRVPQFR